MRTNNTAGDLTVSVVAGTYVVLLAMDMPEKSCNGLLGFAIHRTDHQNDEAYWLEGMKVFPSAKLDLPPGSKVSTLKHPIQGFTWSDFSAKPGRHYTYKVVAMRGEPTKPERGDTVSVEVHTETERAESGHEIFFNRGTAASQEYTRRFEGKRPDEVGDEAYKWLSRGLYEALIGFIERASGKDWGLRVAAYEFTELSVLRALGDAAKRKADVQIVYHARERVDTKMVKGKKQTTPTGANRRAVNEAKIGKLCTERQGAPAKISHNKFIVLLHKGKPVSVLMGSTNYTRGGIFGHSNVVHIVNDPEVAKQYLAYWTELHGDPDNKTLKPVMDALCDVPKLPLKSAIPAKNSTMIFSPRSTEDALAYYAALSGRAAKGLFMTFAFGMNDAFQQIYQNSKAGLRMTVMEKMAMPGKNLAANEAKIIALRKQVGNRFAIGGVLPVHLLEHWVKEKLTGFNVNVKFLHTKYSLIDPLSEDPIIITGSANFSRASCVDNDENMLVVRGDKRVADIYLGEFMRLYKHYSFRDWLIHVAKYRSKKVPIEFAKPLTVEFLDEKNKWWKRWFGQTDWAAERKYFRQ